MSQGQKTQNRATGICAMVQGLANTLQTQNECLAKEKAIVQSIKQLNAGSGSGLGSQLADMSQYFQADIMRMEEEFQVQSALQKAENIRLQQSLTTLKGEKVSITQQIVALQRRVEEMELELGSS